MAGHVPRRRCVGCGRVAPKPQLIRIALDGEQHVPPRRAVRDLDATMPGRGAYLCRGTDPESPNQACVEQAMRRGAVARALRCAVIVDPKLVESIKKVAQPADGRLAETGIRAEGACHPASVGPLAI